jgi:hypothetical protein
MPIGTADWTIGAYTLNGAALAKVSALGHAEGKRVSMEQLARASAPFDDGDHYLVESELRRGLATIAPTVLPPQTGLATTPSVRAALCRAFGVLKSSFSDHEVDAVPTSFARVIVESTGGVSSPDEVFYSAYLAHDPSRNKISHLRARSTIYFERKKLGEPTRLYGPFQIDRLGIPIEADRPVTPSDGVDEAALLGALPSQTQLARAKKKGELVRADFYRYDYTTDADLAVYDQLAERSRARLSTAQRLELDELVGYGVLGNLDPQLNRALAEGSRHARAGAALLDAAIDRGVALRPGTLLFRGIAAEALEGKQGRTITDPRYLCTSLDPGMARFFADKAKDRGGKSILLAIEIGDGVKGLITGNRGETEVLLPRNLKLTVVGKRCEKGYTLYHVRAG